MSAAAARRTALITGASAGIGLAFAGQGSGAPEEASVPAAGGERDGAGFVLEHPPHEVAPGEVVRVDDPYGTAGQPLVREHAAEHLRQPVVGEQFVPHGALVRPTGAGGVGVVTGGAVHDGLGSESPGEQGLPDALARHDVGGACGVTDEQHPACAQRSKIGRAHV